MTERQAAVAWLEKDYDKDLELLSEEFVSEEWGPLIHYWGRAHRRWNSLMFTVKDQNG